MNQRTEAILRVVIAAGFVAVGIIGVIGARGFTDVGRWFPYYTSIAIVVLGSFILVRELLAARTVLTTAGMTDEVGGPSPSTAVTPSSLAQTPGVDESGPQEEESDEFLDERQPLGKMVLWWLVVALFTALVYLFGLLLMTPVFVLLALRFSAGTSWQRAAVAALIGTGVIFGLHELLHLPLPPSRFLG